MEDKRKRNGCITIWIWFVVFANLFSCYQMITYVLSPELSNPSNVWGYGVQAAMNIIVVLSCILLMRWNRIGFFIFVACSLVTSVISYMMYSKVTAIVGFFSILAWWLILQIKKDGVSAWKLMDNGWDYKHCRHLYQVFATMVLIVILLTGYMSGKTSDNPEEKEDKEISEDNRDKDNTDLMEWEKFSDDNEKCTVEVPNDYIKKQINDEQILGLYKSDNDPAVVVICESKKDLMAMGISNSKEYAELIVKLNRETDGVKDFKIISKERYGENSFLIVYDIDIEGTKVRHNILATSSQTDYYYCMVFCLQDVADDLQPTVSRILTSFKVKK